MRYVLYGPVLDIATYDIYNRGWCMLPLHATSVVHIGLNDFALDTIFLLWEASLTWKEARKL